MLGTSYRQVLWDVAADRFGYVTTQDAIQLGVPPKELPKLVEHGGLDHVSYGLYRFQQFPRSVRDQYAEAVLRVGADAYLTAETVLVFHNLTPLAPRKLRIGVRHRVRAKMPDWIILHHEFVPESYLENHEGIPTKKVFRAIEECIPTMMGERLLEATKVAKKNGLITKVEEAELLIKLEGVK